MELELRGLVIDKSVDAAEELSSALLPEIKFVDFEVRRNLHKAIQSFRETDFDVCLISESFPIEELDGFFKDAKLIQGKRDDYCVFVQVRDTLGEGIERRSLVDKGIATIVTRRVTDGDKAALADAVKHLRFKTEVRRKTIDVEAAVKLIMLEIDRVSKDRKRGIDRPYSRNVLSNFMNSEVGFHGDVMDGYFKALEKFSDKGEADKGTVLKLPPEILELDLPGIKDGTYTGVSLRVWEMLRERYGVELGERPDGNASDTVVVPEGTEETDTGEPKSGGTED